MTHCSCQQHILTLVFATFSDLTIDKVATAAWGKHAMVTANYALVHTTGQSDVVLRKQN